MVLSTEKNPDYGESTITVVGITREMDSRPRYFLVNCDGGKEKKLKFPGLQFRAPKSEKETLEDCARERFREQTGLTIDKMLGLRAILPTRSRHDNQWIFRNIFFGVVNDVQHREKPDYDRKLYLAGPGLGVFPGQEYVIPFGEPGKRFPLQWVKSDNQIIARIATDVLSNFDWTSQSTDWYRQIPCVGAVPQTSTSERVLGCGLAVSSIMLLYQPNENEKQQIILLKRKGDKYPGYAGGKVETPKSKESRNIDPVSCCAKEGAEEFGFPIVPKAMVCCAITPLEVPGNDSSRFYNSIVTYAFVAEPLNPHMVEDALKNPGSYLEKKMESYVVESLDEHRDRVRRDELRMPDMHLVGTQFFKSSPGNFIPLTQIVSSGCK